MSPPKARVPKDPPARGNFVSEWFGHRDYPTVSAKKVSLSDQQTGRCPFLSAAISEPRNCIKPSASAGVCTISSCSNGPRQDWLVCPYRALDPLLMGDAVRRLFASPKGKRIVAVPGPSLAKAEIREHLTTSVRAGQISVVYLQDKLGGEISLRPTDRSPELAFDITMVQILAGSGGLKVGRYGILEVQTMDFHGSYKHAVNNLKDALRLHKADFPDILQQNPGWLSEKIEGPNIANVFKRTFYQMMLKFQVATHEACAGCVLAIPLSVWDSWQRHLGKPELIARGDGTFALARPGAPKTDRVPAWIYVFDIHSPSPVVPNPIVISKIIATDPDSVSHFALKVAPEAAISEGGAASRLLTAIRNRIASWWPELAAV